MLTGRKLMKSSCWLRPPVPALHEVSALPHRLTGLRLLRHFSSYSSGLSSNMEKSFFFCLASRITDFFRVRARSTASPASLASRSVHSSSGSSGFVFFRNVKVLKFVSQLARLTVLSSIGNCSVIR